MLRGRSRSLVCERGELACFALVLWIGACGSNASREDASVGDDRPLLVSDAAPAPDDASAALATEVAPGLPTGLPCDGSSECLSGACKLGVCSDWPGVMRIVVDTTPNGAGIREDAENFPLLVRLNATNFPFHEAREHGEDIRFVDADEHDLAFEIETWDLVEEKATIWVLLPRVLANATDGNTIRMYWGNPLSAPRSSGPSVFGDFGYVFHLTPDTTFADELVTDATSQQKTGKLVGPLRRSGEDSAIAGDAMSFDGEKNLISTSSNSGAPQVFTLSLWFKTSTTLRGGLVGFATQRESNTGPHDRSIAINAEGQLEFSVVHGSTDSILRSMQSYNDGRWHYVTARLAKSGQYLYVDGEAVSDNPAIGGADTYLGYWRFGEEPQDKASDAGPPSGNYFAGVLDEIRVSENESDDAWIKLCYATQRPDATAVSYLR
jgi:hypothetical protein